MGKLDAKKLGLALGLTGAIIYIGCVCLMLIMGETGTIWFFNSILHELDVSTVSQMSVPLGQTIMGVVLTFALGGISGFFIGTIYNMGKSPLEYS